jgi:N-dimethylarginine dimethylaminohydrolase
VVVSNFTSEPRIGETKIGVDFFSLAGFEKVVVCPFKFEGEADLKHIRDNLWVGGYGQRTDIAAFDWMEKEFNIKIIKMQMTDPALYHFDCGFFPLTKKEVMLCTEAFSKVEVDNLREYCTIIDVPYKMAKYGAVNSVRVHRMIYNNSDICELDPITQKDFYEIEIEKNNWMSKTLIEYGMEVRFVNLSEFMKSGALASCLVMHVNRWSYDQELL